MVSRVRILSSLSITAVINYLPWCQQQQQIKACPSSALKEQQLHHLLLHNLLQVEVTEVYERRPRGALYSARVQDVVI